VTVEIADGISRRQTPREVAERLRNIEGVQATAEELHEALLQNEIFSEFVSVAKVDEIAAAATQKTALVQNVLNSLRGVQTGFDVDRVIAREGGIGALGFSRVAVYEVLEGKVIRSSWQWIKGEEGVEERPYRDSFFAEGRQPLPGEAMDEVSRTGKAVLVMDPAEDPRCKVRPAQNPGPFVLIPGNGNIIMFDTLAAGRTIHVEDIELLEALVKVGVETKHRLKSEHREMAERASQRMRALFSTQASDLLDLVRIFLISLTYNFGINSAAVFRRIPRSKKYDGIFGLGSLSEEEHLQALGNLAGVRTEEDVLGVVRSRRIDLKFNRLVRSIEWEGELGEAVVVRGGRFYDTSGKEFETPPAIAEYFLGQKELPAQDFVVFPVRTARTIYGFLYLANPWSGRDIDLEGVATLCRDFITIFRMVRWQKGAGSLTGQAGGAINREQLIGILRRAFANISDYDLAAREYLALIRPEAREARNTDDVREIIDGLTQRFNMPNSKIRVEMVGGEAAFLEKEWLGAVLEAGVIEALQAMAIPFLSDKPELNYTPQDWIMLRLEGDTVIFEIFEGTMGEGMGMKMLKLLDAELREQGMGGVRARAEGNKLLIRLQNLQKK
jgi:hypothetical protein